MDNKNIIIESNSHHDLVHGVEIAFSSNDNIGPVGYLIDKNNTLVLFTRLGKDIIPFVCRLDAFNTINQINSWLQTVQPQEKEPDIDGNCEKGFEFITGHANIGFDCLLKVRPIWAIYSK